MKLSVPAALQACPGVSPWITGWAGAVAHAASSAGAASNSLRIDRLLHHDSAHLELAVLDRESQPALDQVERIAAELLVAPAAEDVQVLANSGGERLEVVGAGDQPGGDSGLLGANLQQQL